ncbi:hypothetical protein GCM10023321_19610 [Pseudonocardia eucalypti]|uniref:Uncharacterized protein n=1 Tax=Pseudonocardia eucalypti TaxID=648755 RepID=A0ABP9PVU2_9PSEU
MTEPVVGSGSWPAWIARVEKPFTQRRYAPPLRAGVTARGSGRAATQPAKVTEPGCQSD